MKLFFLVLCQLIMSCNQNYKANIGNMNYHDIEIFMNTPAWELAQAVETEDVSKIKEILKKDTSLFTYREPLFGTTVLMRAVGNRKWHSAKQLLESGTNPNVISKIGTFALFEAIQDPWYARLPDNDPKFVELLLENKANPNNHYCSPKIKGQTDPIECGTSPLMYSIMNGLEKTKLLLEAGGVAAACVVDVVSAC